MLTMMFAVNEEKITGLILAPVCLLMWFVFALNLHRRRQKYTVPVDAKIASVEEVRHYDGYVYRVFYSLSYAGQELLLPDVATNLQRPAVGEWTRVMIDPDTLQDVFVPKVFRKTALFPLLFLLVLTLMAFSMLF